jgi:gamma-glutamyltranspeptidase/glutathione hydrolase
LTFGLQSEWDASGSDFRIAGTGMARLANLGGFYSDIAFAGLSTELDLDYASDKGLTTAPATIEIALVDVGLPIENISASVLFDAADLSAAIERLQMNVFGGLVRADPLAFADRNYYLGDPRFVDVPVGALMSPAYIEARAALIDPAAAIGDVSHGMPVAASAFDFAPSPLTELTSTSHFSIVDRYGDAVSMTTSVQGAFGSQLMVGGFILNNQLTDFAFVPEVDGRPVANAPAAGKRPLSSMTPTVVLDSQGRLKMLIGSPGGTRIINFVTQALVGVLDFGLDIDAAVAVPHDLSRGGPIELEERTDLLEHVDRLRALGHEVVERNLNSGLHGIVVEHTEDGRTLWGGVDPRREGVALGR